MYHIKPDKRSRASAEDLTQGLLKILKTKPLTAVTVSELHRSSGVSRATFYRLFDTPEDILLYQMDLLAIQASEFYEENLKTSTASILEQTIALGMQNTDLLQAIVNNGRFDLLYHHTEVTFRLVDAKRKIFPEDMGAVEREYIISHLSLALGASMMTWMRNGRKDTAAEVARYLKGYIQVVSALIEDV